MVPAALASPAHPRPPHGRRRAFQTPRPAAAALRAAAARAHRDLDRVGDPAHVVNIHGAAQPNKQPYELQERCDKRAADLFERDYRPRVENTKDVQRRFNYEDHYSARLDKCFFLEISSSYDREGGKLTSSKIMRLVELNDNKDYGVFVSGLSDRGPPVACLLEDKICQSESEWRQLLKPFMED